jgi:hypothetical protein
VSLSGSTVLHAVSRKLLYYCAPVGRLAALYSQQVFDSVFSFSARSQQKVSEIRLDALLFPRVTSRTAELVFTKF